MIPEKYWPELIDADVDEALRTLCKKLKIDNQKAKEEYREWRRAVMRGQIKLNWARKEKQHFKKKLGKEMDEEIIEMYLSGMSCQAIGLEIDRSQPTIRQVLMRNNVKLREAGPGKKHWLDNHLEDIKAMIGQGYKRVDIAEKYSINHNTFYNYLRRRGINA